MLTYFLIWLIGALILSAILGKLDGPQPSTQDFRTLVVIALWPIVLGSIILLIPYWITSEFCD